MNNYKYTKNSLSQENPALKKELVMKMSISYMSKKAKWKSQTECISNKKHKPQWIGSLPVGSTK